MTAQSKSVTLLSHLMADTLGVIACFLIGYFTTIRDDMMKAQNLAGRWTCDELSQYDMNTRPFDCTSHFLHALETVVKRSQVSPTSLNNIISQRMWLSYWILLATYPPHTHTTDSVCSSFVNKAKMYTVKQNTVFSSDSFFEWHLKNAPLLVLLDLFWNEKTEGGKRESSRGQQGSDSVSFSRQLCWFRADWKVLQPANKSRQPACALVTAFLAAWRVLDVLCVSCLKVPSWNCTTCLAIKPNIAFFSNVILNYT